MNEQPATATYHVPLPFESAVKTLRRALAEAGLKVTMELNVSDRIRRRLLVGMSPCLILFASSTDLELETTGELAPLHVVISAHGEHSEIHILRVIRSEEAAQPAPGVELLKRLQSKIAQTIGTIAMRAP